jgi:CheY-like chemotaxis protein
LARILVIDDDEQVRTMLCKSLQGRGHEVLTACDGASGLELFRRNPVGIVITDIMMPDGDGTIGIHRLRNDYPDVRIIAISGGGEIVQAESCLNVAKRVGADLVFAKPLCLTELFRAIEELASERTGPAT